MLSKPYDRLVQANSLWPAKSMSIYMPHPLYLEPGSPNKNLLPCGIYTSKMGCLRWVVHVQGDLQCSIAPRLPCVCHPPSSISPVYSVCFACTTMRKECPDRNSGIMPISDNCAVLIPGKFCANLVVHGAKNKQGHCIVEVWLSLCAIDVVGVWNLANPQLWYWGQLATTRHRKVNSLYMMHPYRIFFPMYLIISISSYFIISLGQG